MYAFPLKVIHLASLTSVYKNLDQVNFLNLQEIAFTDTFASLTGENLLLELSRHELCPILQNIFSHVKNTHDYQLIYENFVEQISYFQNQNNRQSFQMEDCENISKSLQKYIDDYLSYLDSDNNNNRPFHTNPFKSNYLEFGKKFASSIWKPLIYFYSFHNLDFTPGTSRDYLLLVSYLENSKLWIIKKSLSVYFNLPVHSQVHSFNQLALAEPMITYGRRRYGVTYSINSDRLRLNCDPFYCLSVKTSTDKFFEIRANYPFFKNRQSFVNQNDDVPYQVQYIEYFLFKTLENLPVGPKNVDFLWYSPDLAYTIIEKDFGFVNFSEFREMAPYIASPEVLNFLQDQINLLLHMSLFLQLSDVAQLAPSRPDVKYFDDEYKLNYADWNLNINLETFGFVLHKSVYNFPHRLRNPNLTVEDVFILNPNAPFQFKIIGFTPNFNFKLNTFITKNYFNFVSKIILPVPVANLVSGIYLVRRAVAGEEDNRFGEFYNWVSRKRDFVRNNVLKEAKALTRERVINPFTNEFHGYVSRLSNKYTHWKNFSLNLKDFIGEYKKLYKFLLRRLELFN